MHQHTLQLFKESCHWERHLKKKNSDKKRYEAFIKAIHQIYGE